MVDPQITDPQVPIDATHDVFGWSEEVFSHPEMVTPVNKTSVTNEEATPSYSDLIASEYSDSELEEEINRTTANEEVDMENLMASKFQTDLQKKFWELFSTTQKIYNLKHITDGFDILGADNDKLRIVYNFVIENDTLPILAITKTEEDKESGEESTHILRFTYNDDTLSLEVTVNEVMLFDEKTDLEWDVKKKMQVMDKLNKFIFLASEEIRKIEKELKQKEEEEREKRKLQDIFRNF